MNEFEDMIERLARDAEEKEIVARTAPLGYFAQAIALFKGKAAWVNWVIMVTQIALFAVAIWCAVQFYAATEALVALKWGLSGAVLLLMAAMMKMSLMPVMQTERLMREIRRLELLLLMRR